MITNNMCIQELETATEFINRICTSKNDLGWTWKDVANHINKELKIVHSDSWYRKHYNAGDFDIVNEKEDVSSCCEDCSETASDIDAKLRALAYKRVEVSDLVIQNNAYVRRLSREQSIIDIAHDYATIMSKEKMLETPVYKVSGNNDAEAILLLSDWHYGMVCDNPWNTFNPEVCKERVNKLLAKVVDILNKNDIDTIHVLDLADLIAGRIHTQIRIESRFDVITQTMDVAEILAEFINELSYHCNVKFYSCLDNHSRLEPNKKESMDLESLARIIPWYLVERMRGNDSVEIFDNEFGADIITCTVAGHNVIGVHGDNDRPTNALERLSLMTHKHYDMLCTSHLHHFSCDEQHQSIVVANSSLMGVDRYAEKLRLTSDPSQTLIIATPENVCECIHRIVLK